MSGIAAKPECVTNQQQRNATSLSITVFICSGLLLATAIAVVQYLNPTGDNAECCVVAKKELAQLKTSLENIERILDDTRKQKEDKIGMVFIVLVTRRSQLNI